MGWKRVRSVGRRLAPALLLTLALAIGGRSIGHGQPVVTTVSNGTITAVVGVSGQTQNATPAVNAAGRFGVFSNGTLPFPLLTMADNALMQSYVTVRIDGGPPTPGVDADNQTSPGWDLIWGDVGTNALDAGTNNQKTNQSAWIQQPTAVGNNRIVARWAVLRGTNSATPPVTRPSIEVDLNLTLVHDMVSYQFTVINTDSQAHTVALRFAQDYNVPRGSTILDVPVFLPNLGNVTTEADLTGSSVPPYWRATDQASCDTVGAQLGDATGTLAGRPSELTFLNVAKATNLLWTVTPTANQAITDGGSDVYFFSASYAPGESRTVTTFFGKMHSTIDYSAPLAAGVDAPLTLSYDPSKPAGQQITPNPFTVTAFAQNMSLITLTNVTATISLPPGLTLAAGETATKSVAVLAPDSETSYAWKVVPTGTASGHLNLTVSFSASPGTIGKSVVRGIDIPALPSQGFVTGWQMVSFPYTFDDPTPSVALGLNALNFDLVRWNQVTAQYEIVTTLQPGLGYWLRLNSSATVALQGAHPVSTGTDYEIRLQNGWNQIGNPFLFPVKWADVKVISTDPNDPDRYTPLPVTQASDGLHRWILPTLYWYDTTTGAYAWSTDFSADLVPFRGYWVKANKPGLSLLVPQPSGRAALIPLSTRAASAPGSGWKVRLVATAGGVIDSNNFLGMRSGASNSYDLSDVEKPPSPTRAASLSFAHPDWTTGAGAYAQDVRSASGRQEWTVQVSGGQANQDVTLTWPDISNLPRAYELYITDPSSGQRVAMRQASSLRVHTGATGTSRVVVTAEPRTSAGAFRILNWSVNRSRAAGSVTIGLTTSQDASLNVRVVNSAGQTLRTLTSRATTGRAANIVWDYKDGKGIAVPSGMYVIEVRGTTPDGQSASVPIPHVVTR